MPNYASFTYNRSRSFHYYSISSRYISCTLKFVHSERNLLLECSPPRATIEENTFNKYVQIHQRLEHPAWVKMMARTKRSL